MLNILMIQEAIASTEIEIGPFTDTQRLAMLFYISSNGDLTMKEATKLAEKAINV